MNKLTIAKRAAILRGLVEGGSLRSVARMTGADKDTVMRLLVEVGEFCGVYQDHVLTNLPCKRVQVDEIWSFVGAKDRNIAKADRKALRGTRGDVWTWTAICADTKLVPSWYVGMRDARAAHAFLGDLEPRLANRVQLTSDGHSAYLQAVEDVFGWNGVDYAMLVKIYGPAPEGERAYSPPVCLGAQAEPIMGMPDRAHVSTSYAERQNLTMRMGMRRFTRLTNGFSKKVANHIAAISLHFMHYNFCRPHTTLTKAAKGIKTTPAMAAGVTDRVWTVEDILARMEPDFLLQ